MKLIKVFITALLLILMKPAFGHDDGVEISLFPECQDARSAFIQSRENYDKSVIRLQASASYHNDIVLFAEKFKNYKTVRAANSSKLVLDQAQAWNTASEENYNEAKILYLKCINESSAKL